jgi:hypothetical protein
MNIIGQRRAREHLPPPSPAEALARAAILQQQAERLNPYPRLW